MEVTATLTPGDGLSALLTRTRRIILALCLTFVVLMFSLLGVAARSVQPFLFSAGFVALLALILLAQILMLRRTLARGPTTWTIRGEGLEVRNELSESVVRWQAFTKLSDVGAAVILRHSLIAFVIPAKAFSSAAERSAFVAELRARTGL